MKIWRIKGVPFHTTGKGRLILNNKIQEKLFVSFLFISSIGSFIGVFALKLSFKQKKNSHHLQYLTLQKQHNGLNFLGFLFFYFRKHDKLNY